MKTTITTFSEEETINAGFEFGKLLFPGDIVALTGELGAGKTEFVKGICNSFQVNQLVTSPTFTIINQYEGQLKGNDISLFHIDLYRIKNQNELDEIGLDECMADDEIIKMIEWSEKAGTRLKKIDYQITIDTKDDDKDSRVIRITKLIKK
jgi:tRNA threonylcarbamoyladenosine biosynthesis protein TsaE